MKKLLELIKVRPAQEVVKELAKLREQNAKLTQANEALIQANAKLDQQNGLLRTENHKLRNDVQIESLRKEEAVIKGERAQADLDELRERYCKDARERMLSPAGAAGSERLFRELTSQLP
ncbi:MAG: hypothetical protein AAF564_17845 [Bacteroidota bacterium]